MTLDELITKLEETRNQVGGSVNVIADSETYVVSCHQIQDVKDECNDRDAVVITLTK